MRCTIFYFSGTGNTKWTVEKITKQLKMKKYDAVNYSIEKSSGNLPELITDTIENSDYIGFAYPLYGANVPRIMRSFFEEFIKSSKVYYNSKAKLFFINTFGYVNGHGYFSVKKAFKKCHLSIMGYVNFRLVNNISKQEDAPPRLGNEMPERIKKKAYSKIEQLLYSLENDKKIIQGIGPHMIVGAIIRNILKEAIQNNYHNMSVDYASCIKCMKCVEKCPTQSIKFEKEVFTFNASCETCWRCHVLCPVNAILMNKKPSK